MFADINTTREELAFCRLYGWRLFAAHVLFVGLVLCRFPEFNRNPGEDFLSSFGKPLTSPLFVAIQAALVSFSVYASLRASGLNRLKFRNNNRLAAAHGRGSGNGDPDTNQRFDFTKGTLLRRTIQRIKYCGQKLQPIKVLVKGALSLTLMCILVTFVVFCFGAPLNFPPFTSSANVEYGELTASFAALVSVHAFLPVLLVYGCDTFGSAYEYVFLQRAEEDSNDIKTASPAAVLLFYNGFGAAFGAWLGAFPIPLDWDRPWQAWPITCSIGCVLGAVTSNVIYLALLKLGWNALWEPSLIVHKAKKST